MKPDLKQLLQERFQAHEADVDPGVWEAIQSQIATTMPATDVVENIFRQRFQQHEVHVDPGVWNAISAQIGKGAVAGTATGGSFLGWFAAASTVVMLSVGTYLYTNTDTSAELALEHPMRTEQKKALASEGSNTAPNERGDAFQSEVEPEVTPSIKKEVASVEGTVVKASPKAEVPITLEDRSKTTATTMGTEVPKVGGNVMPADARTPEEGTAVVKGVIDQVAHEIYLEASASPQIDPAGPPPVEVENSDPPAEMPSAPPTAKAELPEIFMPNTFTPNGDGINDTYSVSREGFKSMMIRIYSISRNTLVFSTDLNEEWDGANSEKGYYLVAIEAVTENGEVVTKGKAVWLNNDRY